MWITSLYLNLLSYDFYVRSQHRCVLEVLFENWLNIRKDKGKLNATAVCLSGYMSGIRACARVYVCSHVGGYAHGHVWSLHLHVCRDRRCVQRKACVHRGPLRMCLKARERLRWFSGATSTPAFVIWHLTGTFGSQIKLIWLAKEPQDFCLRLSSPALAVKTFSTITGYLSRCWGLNAGLCDCAASSLSTELFLQPFLQCSVSQCSSNTHAVLLIARFRLKFSFPTTSFRCLSREFCISVSPDIT